MIWLNVLLFIVGLVLLIKGGDWFVDGASGLALRFGMSEILVGATIVSIGTTLPEVMVSAGAALSGHGEIAYGNAVGSIICNTSLIAAITIAIKPGKVERKSMILPLCFFFGAGVLYLCSAYLLGGFPRWIGILLLALFIVYMITSLLTQKNTEKKTEEICNEKTPLYKQIVPLVVGAALIAIGADLLVDHGTVIAQELGVPEAVIALTFVALGTSLPELVTAITSLVKGHGALSLGNVIGANLFNLVLVSGVSATLSPFTVPQSQTINGIASSLVLDLPLMIGVMAIMTIPALISGKMRRWQGISLLGIYGTFCVLQFVIF